MNRYFTSIQGAVSLSIILTSFLANAQNRNTELRLFSPTNETSNYIHMLGPSLIGSTDTSFKYEPRNYKIVKEYLKGEAPNEGEEAKLNSDKFELQPVQSLKALKKLLPAKIFKSFMKVFDLKTEEQVFQYFKTHQNPKDYPIFYKSKEVKIALGHLFEDNDVEKGSKYHYKVFTKNNGKEVLWGESWVVAGTGNPTLEYLTEWTISRNVQDSSVALSWIAHVQPETVYLELDSAGYLITDFLPFVLSIPTLDAKVYCSTGDDFVAKDIKLMSRITSSGDSLVYDYRMESRPNEFVAAYIRLVDEVGNLGPPSDTIWAYSVSRSQIPILESIHSKEVTDGVRLSWDALPHRPYFSGIVITRGTGSEVPDTLAVLNYKDTLFVDKTIEPAKVYTYYAKAMYSEGVSYEQEYPAKAVGQYMKFTIPEIPENLTATNVGKNVLLEWDEIENPGLFGYYIYKGTHPNKIKLYKGPIETNSFIDSSKAMKGGSVYYYQVRSENVMQDVSDLSDYVSTRPDRPVGMRVPENMSFYYENGNLQISWNDVRLHDRIIGGYLIKRHEESGEYPGDVITEKVLQTTSFVDSNYIKETLQFYSIAPVSIHGDTGEYSKPVPFLYEEPRFDAVYEFELYNSKDGIVVGVPPVDFGDGRRYKVYRRTAEATTMKAITTLPEGSFEYIDKSAQKNQKYVYAIRIIYSDGKEGPFGYSKSLRRSN